MKTRHALGMLIEQIIEANDWSDERVAQAARSKGYSLSSSSVSRIRNQEYKTMPAQQMHALAAALNLPLRVVVASGLESMGLPTFTGSETSVEDAIQADRSIPARERSYLLALLAEVRRNGAQSSEQYRKQHAYDEQAKDERVMSADALSSREKH